MEYGGFGVRFGARLLDLLYNSIGVFVFAFVGGLIGFALHGMPVAGGHFARTFVFSLSGTLLCEAIAEGLGGSTLGKMTLGLRVVRPDGSPISFGAGLGRSLAFFLDAQFVGLVAWTSMSGSMWKQRYGDKWANTVVVRVVSIADRSRLKSPVVPAIVGVVAYGVLMMIDAIIG